VGLGKIIHRTQKGKSPYFWGPHSVSCLYPKECLWSLITRYLRWLSARVVHFPEICLDYPEPASFFHPFMGHGTQERNKRGKITALWGLFSRAVRWGCYLWRRRIHGHLLVKSRWSWSCFGQLEGLETVYLKKIQEGGQGACLRKCHRLSSIKSEALLRCLSAE